MTLDGLVHVIDDDEEVLRSLSFLLSAHDLPCRTYADPLVFAGLASPDLAGCILSDVRMPGMDGVELLSRIREARCEAPVVLMTGHADVALAVRAMKAGAADFLEKPFTEGELLAAVSAALAANARRLEDRASREATSLRLGALSPRETEILEKAGEGLSTKMIAGQLGLSPRTVEVHRANILAKLGVRNITSAVSLVIASRSS